MTKLNRRTSDQRGMNELNGTSLKNLTMKALAATVFLGAAVFGTGATAFAAGSLPNGAVVKGAGSHMSDTKAGSLAWQNASGQCASGYAGQTFDEGAKYEYRTNSDGSTTAWITTTCGVRPSAGAIG
ncbi:hypothetical protein [Streptomyces adelaidensis]|uniref:hypothetical protein n=1 Tax=Streptomyces adelaidensis TaxID=2796465 RepID=UPI001906C98B|nr:hypothetical protein [Streptomyces adelaidensis]